MIPGRSQGATAETVGSDSNWRVSLSEGVGVFPVMSAAGEQPVIIPDKHTIKTRRRTVLNKLIVLIEQIKISLKAGW